MSSHNAQGFKPGFQGQSKIPFEKKTAETYGTIGYGNNYGNSFINAKLKASKAAVS